MSDLCGGPPLSGSGLLSVAGRPSRAKLGQVGGDRALNGVDVVYKASFGRLGVSECTSAFAVETINDSPEGVGTHPKLASDYAHGGHSSEFRVALRFHPCFRKSDGYSDFRMVHQVYGKLNDSGSRPSPRPRAEVIEPDP
jgi:hypothetical protein